MNTKYRFDHRDIDRILGSHSTHPWQAHSLVTDSRSVTPGCMFVAIKGERVDGHDFLENAYRAGANAALVTHHPDSAPSDLPLVIVKDVVEALHKIATECCVQQKHATFIGVTGSVGKTSTKEMLAAALSDKNTYATPGNANSQIGLPVAVAHMPENLDYAIIEMGIDRTDQMVNLAYIVRSHVAVITAIQPVHIENFDSIEGIIRAKSEIMCGMRKPRVCVIPKDSEHYDALAEKVRLYSANPITFGKDPTSDICLRSYHWDGHDAHIVASIFKEELVFRLSVPGEHMALNAMAALAVISSLQLDIQKAAENLYCFKPIAGRGVIHHIEQEGKKWTLIDESYNAGLAAMKATIQNASNIRKPGQRLVTILGDMKELGDMEERTHVELANHIKAANVDFCIGVGSAIKVTLDELDDDPKSMHYHHVKDMLCKMGDVMSHIQDGDIVLVKASRSVGLDHIVHYFTHQKVS